MRHFDLATGHLDYLKAVGFGAQDFVVHGDSLPVLVRFPLLFAVDRVFGNNPNYTFVLLKNATQTTREIVDVLRRVPWVQIRLMDEASFTQRVGPDDLWQLAVGSFWDNRNHSGWVLEESDIVSRIIACKYTVQTLLDAGWNSTRFQRHAEETHVALARAGYDFHDLRKLGFTARLLERSGVRQSQETLSGCSSIAVRVESSCHCFLTGFGRGYMASNAAPPSTGELLSWANKASGDGPVNVHLSRKAVVAVQPRQGQRLLATRPFLTRPSSQTVCATTCSTSANTNFKA